MTAAWITTFVVLLSGPAPGRVAPPKPVPPPASPVMASLAQLAEVRMQQWRFSEAELLLGLLEANAPHTREVVRARVRQHYLLGRYRVASALLKRTFGPNPRSVLAARVEAAAQVVGPMVTHKSASGRFVIRCPRGTDELLLPYAEAVLERSHQVLSKELGWVPDGPVRVEILPGAEELALLSPLALSEVRRTGTTGLSQDHRIMLITPRAVATGYGWADTLAHEYVHYVLEVKARHRVPLWLHEGLARFLQDRWRGPLPTRLEPLQRHRLATGLRDRRLVPLSAMVPSFAKLKDHRQAALAYAQVASMVLDLHQIHATAGLRRLIDGLASGQSIDTVLRSITGRGLVGYVARWRERLVQRRLQPVPAFEPRGRQFKKGPLSQVRKRSPFERLRRLGAILRARARPVAAAVEYNKALALVQGADADTANTLARILIRLGRSGEAAQVAARALPYGDHVAALHIAAARAAERLGQPLQAEHHLTRANQIDPFDPEIHCSLARLMVKRAAPQTLRETRFCQLLKSKQ